VIEDYKKALVLLKSKNKNIENKFNRNIFTQILAKIKAIGITNWKIEIPEFQLYKNYLIEEISKKESRFFFASISASDLSVLTALSFAVPCTDRIL
jgi:hypothetical protein